LEGILLFSPFRVRDRLFYGWIVVIAFFITGVTLAGIHLSFGVFFKSIAAEFNLNRAMTSSIISVSMGFGCVIRVLGGWALDRYGPKIIILIMGLFTGLSMLLTSQTNSLWQLFISYSVLLAIGTSAMYAVTMSTISRWFDRKRGLALGITSAGPGLGMVVMAPFATFLITNLDWRMAYIVMGALAWLIVIPVSLLLKKDPYEIGALPDGIKPASVDRTVQKSADNKVKFQSTGLSLVQASRTRSFWLFISMWIFFSFGVLLIQTHIVPHVTDIGFSAGDAATVLSLIGGSIIVGRILGGTLSDRIGRKTSLILFSLIRAGTLVWLIWSHELWTLYLFALAYGFSTGGFSPNMAGLISETFGLRRIGAIIGTLDVGFGLGAAIGPAIGGLIFDVGNSYSPAFLIGAAAMFLAAVLVTQIRRENL
jgi:MFS family permease